MDERDTTQPAILKEEIPRFTAPACLVGILYRPGRIMASFRERPQWILPLLFALGCGFAWILSASWLANIALSFDPADAQDLSVAKVIGAQNLLRHVSVIPTFDRAGYLLGLGYAALQLLLSAGLITLVMKGVSGFFGQSHGLNRYLAIATHAEVPAAFGRIFLALFGFLHPSGFVTLGDADPVGILLLTGCTLFFSLWQIVLLTVGIAKLHGWRAWWSALFVVVTILLVWLIGLKTMALLNE